MSMENYSLADISAATKDGGFGGGNMGFFWIFALLLLAGGGFGGFGNRTGELGQYATAASQQDILFTQKFDALGQKVNSIGDGICSSTYALNNAITGEGRALAQQLSNCCCENQRNTDALRYDLSQMIASTNANITAQTQKVLDTISENRMSEMQNRINQLELQNAVAGVVRYPSASTYYAGNNPFCANTCNCNANF